MKYLLSGLSLGILAGLGLPSTALAKQPTVNGIGNIQNTKEIRGAGCSLQRRGNKGYVFWSVLEKSALMNIGGKDRVLKLVSATPSAPRVEKKGSRSTEIYKSGRMTVRIDRVTTRVCRKGDQECEVTGYDGKMTLKIGDRQQTIAVEGDCGS
ncbi:hypothetical protein [Chamaesiphon sp. VAR_69_metabat_338]|uniref:hypothetical protein n=1 Tax=Chamaesiphon sp. VAR_69_metabat_338 TaxID=2964704 RepID=UPI00286E2F6C|nr:hypothetical protein [Chamaesiphon sp. VAR_69_metabat_338]